MTQWIAGFSDGDGTFSITKSTNGKSYQFTFKITQSLYNYRALYKIKKWIGYGSISKDGNTLCQYRIRDTKILKKVIVPIFESYPLHTVKYKSYMLWKEALFFPERRESVCKELSEWNKTLKNSEKRIDFKSPHDKIPFKSWIIGFTEAEGSFFLTQKEENRIVHSFGITQKHDIHLLEILKKVFGIRATIKEIKKNGAFRLETSNSRTISFLIDYYKDCFIGIKSAEYRLWARSYKKSKGNFKELAVIQQRLRNMRNKHKIVDYFE